MVLLFYSTSVTSLQTLLELTPSAEQFPVGNEVSGVVVNGESVGGVWACCLLDTYSIVLDLEIRRFSMTLLWCHSFVL